jgi:hypothetical protein
MIYGFDLRLTSNEFHRKQPHDDKHTVNALDAVLDERQLTLSDDDDDHNEE